MSSFTKNIFNKPNIAKPIFKKTMELQHCFIDAQVGLVEKFMNI
jgi:hypothetical protein